MINHWKPILAVLSFPYILLFTREVNADLCILIGMIAALEYGEIWFDTRKPTEASDRKTS